MVPDGLREVPVADDHEVVPEDGEGIDLDVVAPALAPFELDMVLLGRAVLLAQEAGPGGDGLGGGVGGRGAHPLRVPLDPAGEAMYGQLPRFDALERAEIGRGERPDGQLILDKLA